MEFIQSDVFFHMAFWTLLYAVNIYTDDRRFGIWFTLIEEVFNILFYMIIVYINLLVLIPNYLQKNSFLLYSLSLLTASILIAPVNALAMYLLNYQHPYYQETITSNLQIYFLSSFFIAGASTVFKITGDWLKHQREKTRLKNEKLVSELKFLRSQINPHFLFNTLNNVYSLSLQKSDKTPEVILKLSEILRYMLYECNGPKVSLDKEINYIKNYLELEKIRQTKDAKIEFEVIGNSENVEIAPFLFTPFLENAIKHGVNRVLENPCVKIKIEIEEDILHFSISNTKPDVEATQQIKQQPGGIGLVNVERRLKILYPDKYRFKIENTSKKYTILLDLKFK
jgi:two-component system LytT family sensor kinase